MGLEELEAGGGLLMAGGSAYLAPVPPSAAGSLCAACGGPGSLKCGRCKAVSFCGPDCQRAHWKRAVGGHKGECVAVVVVAAAGGGGGGGGGCASSAPAAVALPASRLSNAPDGASSAPRPSNLPDAAASAALRPCNLPDAAIVAAPLSNLPDAAPVALALPNLPAAAS